MYTWLVDIVTASSLPLLYSLANTSLTWPMVASILVIALLATWAVGLPARKLRLPVYSDYLIDFAFDSIKLTLNMATLLTQAERSDSKIGPALCVAPIFTLICLPGAMGLSYETIMRQISASTGAVLVVVSIFMLFLQDTNVDSHSISYWGLQSCVQIFLGALCSNDFKEAHNIHWTTTGRRTIVYLLLASSRTFVNALLRGSSNLLLWFLHGILLLQSCLLLARLLRHHAGKLNVKDPSRFCILINVLLLTAAYSWRETVAHWGVWTSLILFILSVVKLAVDMWPW